MSLPSSLLDPRASSALEVLRAPHPMLATRCAEVVRVDDAIRALARQMVATMEANDGLGLAANQVGVGLRVLVMDVPDEGLDPRLDPGLDPEIGDDARAAGKKGWRGVMVNPRAVWVSQERATQEEGCLSVDEYRDWVERPARCRVAYLDAGGVAAEVALEGLAAACVQHEMDHLDGKLFVDRLSRLKRDKVMRRLRKLRKEEARDDPTRGAF